MAATNASGWQSAGGEGGLAPEGGLEQFLSELLGCGPHSLPGFERGPEVVQFLEEFRRQCAWRRSISNLEEQQAHAQAEEYALEAGRVKEQLKLVGISSSALSYGGQCNIRLLGAVADLLQLRTTKPSVLLAAWSQLCTRELECKRQQDMVRRQEEFSSLALARAKERNHQVSSALTEVDNGKESRAAQVQQWRATAESMAQKREQYEGESKKLLGRIQQSGLKPELCHEALVKKAKQIEGMRRKIRELEDNLRLFSGLPADLELARHCLQKQKEELTRQKGILKSKMTS